MVKDGFDEVRVWSGFEKIFFCLIQSARIKIVTTKRPGTRMASTMVNVETGKKKKSVMVYFTVLQFWVRQFLKNS